MICKKCGCEGGNGKFCIKCGSELAEFKPEETAELPGEKPDASENTSGEAVLYEPPSQNENGPTDADLTEMPGSEDNVKNENSISCYSENTADYNESGKNNQSKKKKVIIAAASVFATAVCALFIFLTTDYSPVCIKHEWKEATCTQARICVKCKKPDGKPLGHKLGEWEKSDKSVIGGSKVRKCTACRKAVVTIPEDRGEKSDFNLFKSSKLSVSRDNFIKHLIAYLPEDTLIVTENKFEVDDWTANTFMITSKNFKKDERYIRFFYGNSATGNESYKQHMDLCFDKPEDIKDILPNLLEAVDSKFAASDSFNDKVKKITEKIENKSTEEYSVKLTSGYLVCKYEPEAEISGKKIPGSFEVLFWTEKLYKEAHTFSKEYFVNTEVSDLRLRKEPNTDSAVLASLPKGTVITVTEQKDGWSKTKYNGKTGWVSNEFIKEYDPNDPDYIAAKYGKSSGSSGKKSSGSTIDATTIRRALVGRWESVTTGEVTLIFYSDGRVTMSDSESSFTGTYTFSASAIGILVSFNFSGNKFSRLLTADNNKLYLCMMNENKKLVPDAVKVSNYTF
ncbi:MAG: SH3 domain-containing protein [Clostridia bacterium]|nr:SH3 domain-containing protein [Clostridia bacterium]